MVDGCLWFVDGCLLFVHCCLFFVGGWWLFGIN